jgi:hypothetical protein
MLIIGFDNKNLGRNPLIKKQEQNYRMNYENQTMDQVDYAPFKSKNVKYVKNLGDRNNAFD